MTDLVTFLRARLDEDAAVALATVAEHEPRVRAATAHRDPEPDEDPSRWTQATQEDPAPGGYRYHRSVWAGDGWSHVVELSDDTHEQTALHIARHDPARVLREVAAKRAIVEQYEADRDGTRFTELVATVRRDRMEFVLRLLASVYADRDEYREEWRP